MCMACCGFKPACPQGGPSQLCVAPLRAPTHLAPWLWVKLRRETALFYEQLRLGISQLGRGRGLSG
jgi:hypothetical protein